MSTVGDPWDEQLPTWAVALVLVVLFLAGLALVSYVLTLAWGARP